MVQQWLSKQIKVVHRIPGRLRLSIPTLQFLPEGYAEFVAHTENLLCDLPGMQGITINCGTASALILYEPTTVTETTLLGWVEQLITAAVRIYNQLRDCANNHLRLLKTRALLLEEVKIIKKRYAET